MTTWNHNKGFIPRTLALFCSKGSFLYAATVVREQGLIHLQITWQQKWSTELISSKWPNIFHRVPYRCPVPRILTRFKVKVPSYETYHKMNHLPKVNSLIFCNTFASVGGCVPWASKPVPFHGASQAILHKETLPSILAVHKKKDQRQLSWNVTIGSQPNSWILELCTSENPLEDCSFEWSIRWYSQTIHSAHRRKHRSLLVQQQPLRNGEQPNMSCCTTVPVFSSSCASSSFCCFWTEINSAKNQTI